MPTESNINTKGLLLKFDNSLELPEIRTILTDPGPNESPDGGYSSMQQTKLQGVATPLVKVNNTNLPFSSITSLELTCDKLPNLNLEFDDTLQIMQTFDKPKSDNIVQVQILPPFDNAYKKINLTFYITYYDVDDDQVSISAVYKVDKFYDNIMKAYGETTTYKFFEDVAHQLRLGFCSNIDSTDDKRWIYIANEKFTKALDRESKFGGSERIILDWWIDYWNNINLVDIYERNNTIDAPEDMMIWALPRRTTEVESVSEEMAPLQMQAIITNNEAFRDNQLYVSSYKNVLSTGGNISGTDRAIEFYKNDSMDTGNYLIEDGDVKNDINTKYDYLGENFGEHEYLKQIACRNMWLHKMNTSTIEVELSQPCLGLMKGHKVNFYWYENNSMIDTIEEQDVLTNINAETENDAYEENGMDAGSVENKFQLNKQVSGQYYIVKSELLYRYNGGGMNWVQTLTLSRPADQCDYFDYENIK